jgi:hypothetical protein
MRRVRAQSWRAVYGTPAMTELTILATDTLCDPESGVCIVQQAPSPSSEDTPPKTDLLPDA